VFFLKFFVLATEQKRPQRIATTDPPPVRDAKRHTADKLPGLTWVILATGDTEFFATDYTAYARLAYSAKGILDTSICDTLLLRPQRPKAFILSRAKTRIN
jgi:hypothetical protein